MAPAAIRADDPGILIGHLVQEGGKRLATMVAQQVNRVLAHIGARHSATPTSLILPLRSDNAPLARPIE